MSIEAALSVIMTAGVLGMVVLLAGLNWVIRVRRRLMSIGETLTVLVAIAAVMLGVLMIVWPETGAGPTLVPPDTPPADPLAGYDSSELP